MHTLTAQMVEDGSAQTIKSKQGKASMFKLLKKLQKKVSSTPATAEPTNLTEEVQETRPPDINIEPQLSPSYAIINEKFKFSKPKIYMIDIPQPDRLVIEEKWLDVKHGSLGKVFEVVKSPQWQKITPCFVINDHEESDIVIIDLSVKELSKKSPPTSLIPEHHEDMWAKLDHGHLDSRLLGSIKLQEDLDRIVKSGGICVVFADKLSPADACHARIIRDNLHLNSKIEQNIWSMLSAFRTFQITADEGENITIVDKSSIGALIERHLNGARHTCTLGFGYYQEKWKVLAESKFRRPVAAIGSDGDGTILVLPQIKDKGVFLAELLGSVLPAMLPHLFPEVEKRSWVHSKEYELSRITELESEKTRVKKEAEKNLAVLDAEIDQYKVEHGWIHSLLDGTGDQLVLAVKKAMKEIGFQKVIDMDLIRDAENKARREDLRIEDRSPLLIVDIKGVGGAPSDSDSTQANKHALINMKEMNRTDVQGLSIINHYRHLPPLSRDNQAFRQEIIDISNDTDLGLMTSFDLYNLLNGMRKHNWPSKFVMDVFYRKGRIKMIPSHYEEIGTIGKVFSGRIGVHLTKSSVKIGDKIALMSGMVYDESIITSIKVEDESVTTATVGERAGFTWPATNLTPREGMPVYRVPLESISN